MTSTSAWINVDISPSPGFCIKSKLLRPGSLNQVALPQGFKVFVNVAWSKDIPPPPDGVLGLVTAKPTSDRQADASDRSDDPIFASDGRLDTDKGPVHHRRKGFSLTCYFSSGKFCSCL